MSNFNIAIILIFSFSLLFNCAQIIIGQTDPNLAEKKKVYCKMISYHFLDDHNTQIQSFTQQISQFRSQLFKNRVAKRLSQNCQQKITTQQLIELSQLLDNLSGHQKQLFDIENKYVQYFTPQNGIVLKLLEEVKLQSDIQINTELQKYHQARKSLEENTKIVVQGFKQIQKYIDQKGRFMMNTMHQITSIVSELHARVNDAVQKIKASPEVKKITELFDQL